MPLVKAAWKEAADTIKRNSTTINYTYCVESQHILKWDLSELGKHVPVSERPKTRALKQAAHRPYLACKGMAALAEGRLHQNMTMLASPHWQACLCHGGSHMTALLFAAVVTAEMSSDLCKVERGQ